MAVYMLTLHNPPMETVYLTNDDEIPVQTFILFNAATAF